MDLCTTTTGSHQSHHKTGCTAASLLLDLRPTRTSCRSMAADGKLLRRGRISAGVLSRKPAGGAIPVVQLLVDGRWCQVLVDTGCTDTIVHVRCCGQWQPRTTTITTISGETFQCTGVGSVTVETSTDQLAKVHALVASEQPLGVDVVMVSLVSLHLMALS
ncbi:hypothetical protein GWK47_028329 [Chionoecetes opilio]|uniref:Uncharacterized protein n=1 Tax=Chionoecetes opilio TaxID=41210 RepID=A0A8J4YLH2_CHIOP|nr:hypothetical protein GWK47_028329 [Chionoecetes opilio]